MKKLHAVIQGKVENMDMYFSIVIDGIFHGF